MDDRKPKQSQMAGRAIPDIVVGQWSADSGKTWHDTEYARSIEEVIFAGLPANADIQFRYKILGWRISHEHN